MTEEEARARVAEGVSRETLEMLDGIVALVTAENDRQNLIAKSTIPAIWERHILDSAQLVWLADETDGLWLDIGSGGGFPGLVVGAMRSGPVTLVEPRARRAAFLQHAISQLGLAGRMSTVAAKVEQVALPGPAALISARAVAALPNLLAMAALHAGPKTLWILPKGRSAASEVAEAEREWQGEFRLAPSLSDPDSAIVIARGVRRKKPR